MKQTFSISVRGLVAFTSSQGDLVPGLASAAHLARARAAHQEIQSSRPRGYEPEYGLHVAMEQDLVRLRVFGRADGVDLTTAPPLVEEIKTVTTDAGLARAEDNPLHWGQLLCYGHMLCAKRGLPLARLRLTLASLDTGHTLPLERDLSAEDLAREFQAMADDYLAWLRTVAAWRAERNASLNHAPFPFPGYRLGQQELMHAAEQCFLNRGRLMVNAPTGVGKTMALLYPALRAVSQGQASGVAFVTARTTGRVAAQENLDLLRSHGVKVNSVSLTAKDKLCVLDKRDCTPLACPRAAGHYDRLRQAMEDGFSRAVLTREELHDLGREHRVCPFELSLDLARWMDVVVGDYNYVFDPSVSLGRIWGESGADRLLLADEAHNLPGRAREMHSAEIHQADFQDLAQELILDSPALHSLLQDLDQRLAELAEVAKQAGGLLCEREYDLELTDLLTAFRRQGQALLGQYPAAQWAGQLDEQIQAARLFLRATRTVEGGAFCLELPKRSDKLTVRLFCPDPAPMIDHALAPFRASVFFSGTLHPLHYYGQALGLGPEADTLSLTSPFPPQNRLVLVADQVSTYYRRRSQTAPDVAELLAGLVMAKPGNYLLFFPSYRYLEIIHPHLDALLQQHHTPTALHAQKPWFSETEREAFLDRYRAQAPSEQSTLVGLAVLGGVFGESVDLPGGRLTGVAVVGVGLPPQSTEREIVKEYFLEREEDGYRFAYVYPAMNRVLQAAGRVVRGERDRGVVLLIDERYTQEPWSELLPPEWEVRVVGGVGEVMGELGGFWGEE